MTCAQFEAEVTGKLWMEGAAGSTGTGVKNRQESDRRRSKGICWVECGTTGACVSLF